jgi:hypothetical protein
MAERRTPMDVKKIVAISLVLILVLVVGEYAIYGMDHTYSSSAGISDGEVSYSVYSSGADVYTTMVVDNGSMDSIHTLYIYYDETYFSNCENVKTAVGAKATTQEYYIEQIKLSLANRGFEDVVVLSADELSSAMAGDIGSDFSKGLLILSGALPDTIYKGNTTDEIFRWMSAGGTLYWIGGVIGECYATQTGLVDVSGYQQLFFGTQCVNTDTTGDTDTAYSDIDSNGFRSALSLMNNSVRYGLDTSGLENSLSIGFTDGTYSSISFVKYGEGQICVIAGNYSSNQRDDCAQIISSGLSYDSKIIGMESGSVTRGTVYGAIDVGSYANVQVYIYIGGYLTVYGHSFWLK